MTPPDLLNLAAGAAVLGLASLTAAVGYGLRTRAAGFLTAFFACFALANLFGTVLLGGAAWLSADAVRWLRVVEVPLVYLLGPLLYGYAIALTRPTHASGVTRLCWHVLPAALAFVVSLLNALAPFESHRVGQAVFLLSFHGWLLQGAPYLLAAVWHSWRAPLPPHPHDAAQRDRQLAWLRGLVVVIVGCWVSSAIGRWPAAPETSLHTWFNVALNGLTTAAMYLLAWSGLRQRILVPAPLAMPARAQGGEVASPALASTRQPYHRSGIDPAQCVQIAAELTRLMERERLYSDPGLDLAQLSRRSGWTPNHVSQALNQGLGQNFAEFVNTFRLAAATASLGDADDPRSVLDIALASGFGSKSTFNTVFKRMTGQTPRAYRRALVPGATGAP